MEHNKAGLTIVQALPGGVLPGWEAERKNSGGIWQNTPPNTPSWHRIILS